MPPPFPSRRAWTGWLRLAVVGLVATATPGAAQSSVRFRFKDSARHRFSSEARSRIEAIGIRAIADARALLPLPQRIEIEIADGTRVVPETGEGGVALAPGRIRWVVDAERAGGPAAIAERELRATLYHELHHLVRGWTMAEGYAGGRMIDAAVAEGLATAFERDRAGRRPPWGEYPPDVAAWVEEILQLSDSAKYGDWMLAHPDGRRWIGYRAGTFLADRAVARSGLPPSLLAHLPTTLVLSLAGVAQPCARLEHEVSLDESESGASIARALAEWTIARAAARERFACEVGILTSRSALLFGATLRASPGGPEGSALILRLEREADGPWMVVDRVDAGAAASPSGARDGLPED